MHRARTMSLERWPGIAQRAGCSLVAVALTTMGLSACSGMVGPPVDGAAGSGSGGSFAGSSSGGGAGSGAGAMSAGSSGSAGGASGSGAAGAGSGPSGTCEPAATRRVRRLAQREYLNVVSDLLGAAAAAGAAPRMPLEPTVAGFDNQDDGLLASASFQEALADIAEKLSAAADPVKVAPCATPAGTPACLQTFTRAFARRAFGRAPSEDEVQHLLAVAATGSTYAVSVRLVVEVVLQSPQMLYATELGPDAAPQGGTITLTPAEVASQLSLLLTGTRPDDELLRAADEGRLRTPDDLRIQVTRLLATPRARPQLRLFVNGWLDMGKVADAPKNVDTYPELTPAVAAAMQEELDAFIDTTVASGEGTLSSLMSTTSTHIPAALLPIYGSDVVASLPAPSLNTKHRRGVLTLPGLLAYHAADQHSGPIERGLMVRRQLLCQDIPPPPPSVLERIAQNPIDTTNKATTTRAKYQQHKNDPSCAACHNQFDVIGFGMEEMDGIGRYRTTENGLPVDTSGQLSNTDVDGPFSGVAQLSEKLAGSEMFATCFVQQFFRFAEARPPEESEQCVVEAWAKSFASSGGHLKDLMLRWVSDPAFAVRREDR